jgi:hypothetical protein
MPLLSIEQHAAARNGLIKTDASNDTVSYAQILALAGASGLQTNKQGDAIVELLGGGSLVDAPNQTTKIITVKHLIQTNGHVVLRKGSKGWLVEGFRLTPAAQTRFSEASFAGFEGAEVSDVAPFTPPPPGVVQAQAQALDQAQAQATQMRAKAVRIGDYDVQTASTTMTVGGRIESIRARLGAPRPADSAARVTELEETVKALNEALDKVNATLRKYQDAFNCNSGLLDETRTEVGNLRYSVTSLKTDVDGLYGDAA